MNKYSIFPLGKIKLTGLQVAHLEGFCQLHSRKAESKFDRRWPGRLSELSASSRLSQSPLRAGWKGENAETLSSAASSWKAVVNPPSLQAGSNTEESHSEQEETSCRFVPVQVGWSTFFFVMFFWKCFLCIFISFFS